MPRILPTDEEIPGLLPGRGSVTWRVAGDVRLFAAAPYALLLQVAHPVVGAGVAQYSDFAADPWGRLLRTLDYVTGTVYGGPELAGEIGRRVRGIHTSIKGVRPDGERYHALEPDAYAWVHATLAQSIVHGHRWLGSPMTALEQEAFWGQWRRLGHLVGVRDRDLPERWADFAPYFRRMVRAELRDNETVHVVYDTLSRPDAPPVPGLPDWLWRVLRVPAGRHGQLLTRGLLGAQLCEKLRLPWSPAHERRFKVAAALSRATTPLIVGPLAEFGPVYVRLRRKQLARGDVGSGRAAMRAA